MPPNPSALRAVGAALERHLDRKANQLRNDIVGVLRDATPGRGARYGNHVASAPGDPPATDTGRLISSIRWEAPRPLVRLVGTNVRYAEALEYGARGRGLAARPFMRPALEKFRKRRG